MKRTLFLFCGRYSFYLIHFSFPSVILRWKVRNVESDIINNSIRDLIILRNEYDLDHFSSSKQAKQKLFIKVKHLQIYEGGNIYIYIYIYSLSSVKKYLYFVQYLLEECSEFEMNK